MAPVLSPEIYHDIVLPSEVALSEYHGGIVYWHSCGDTNCFQKEIDTIPNLSVVDISPWTDLAESEENYSADKKLEKRISSRQFRETAPVGDLKRQLETFKETVKNHAFSVKAEVGRYDHPNVKEWIDLANDILLN